VLPDPTLLVATLIGFTPPAFWPKKHAPLLMYTIAPFKAAAAACSGKFAS
jgi:hypothetical protein